MCWNDYALQILEEDFIENKKSLDIFSHNSNLKFHFLTNERDNEAFTLVAEIFPEYNFEEIVDIHFNHLQKLSSFVRNNWSSTSDEEILNEEKVFDLRVAGKEVMKARMEGRSEDDFIFENESLNGRDEY